MGADIVGTLYVVLGLKDEASGQLDAANAKMEKSTQKTTGSMMDRLTDWRDATNASLREYAKWATAIGVYAGAAGVAVGAAYATVEAYGGMAQQIKDLSYVMGVSTTKVQQLQYAATLAGTNFDKVAFSVSNVNLKIAEAGDESSTAAKAFRDLGVSIEGQTPDQVFEATAAALAKVSDSTERARLGNELLGRSWREVLPFIDEYIARKKEVAAHETLSEDDIKTLAEYKSTIDGIVSSLNLYIAKAVVAAERATTFGSATAKTTPLQGGTIPGQVAAEKAIKDAQDQYDLFSKKYGALTPPSAIPPETYDVTDIISGMSDAELQIYEMENITLPALKRAWDAAIKAGDPDAIKQAAFAYAQAERELDGMKSNTEALTSATDEYSDSLKKVLDLERDRADLSADAAEDLTNAMGDPEQFRSILQNYRRSLRESDQSLGSAEANVRAAGAAVYNTVNPGSVKSGDVVINLDGVEIARVKGVANTGANEVLGLSKSDLTKAGVRMS